MRNIRRAVRITIFLILALWLHYVLPQRDIARVTSTEVVRTDFSGLNRTFFAQTDTGNAESVSRDLRFINAERKKSYLFNLIRSGRQTIVYRNEDTGWIYPPYFKFDSADLQAEAGTAISTEPPHDWVVITHYGWRINWLSIYPNAVSIRPAPGEDFRPIPWSNFIIYALMLAGVLFVRAMWRQFRERTLDPLTESAEDRMDHVQADFAKRRGRLRRWWDNWRGK
jgi:hypothetical protein